MVGLPPQCPRLAPRVPAVHGSNPGYYACRVATPLWPCACIVWPKLSMKGAVFALAVGQVPAVELRGSVSDFLVGYATLVTSCDSPPGLRRMPYASPLPDKLNAVYFEFIHYVRLEYRIRRCRCIATPPFSCAA